MSLQRSPIVTGSQEDVFHSPPGGRRALFLDRDGVINVNHGYVHTPERTDWVPGIFELARAAKRAGLALVVVTNQAGIARGYYTEEQFEVYTRWMHQRFENEGAPLLATYYCPHHPDAGQGALRVQCECRKPRPGMLKAAARDYAIDLGASMLIGDKKSDVIAALSAGIRHSFLLGDEFGEGTLDYEIYTPVTDLKVALNYIRLC